MPYYNEDVLRKVKQIDLLTYLQQQEPSELVKVAPRVYTTKTHDSLKISNGKWAWWSRGIGGRSALDYLIKVRELPFLEAVESVMQMGINTPYHAPTKQVSLSKSKPSGDATPTSFCLPKASTSTANIERYLSSRGIHKEIIACCIHAGVIFESAKYHNVVFVGRDKDKQPRYAMERGTREARYFHEFSGSDKRFSFSFAGQTNVLHLFEGAIDLLSYCSLTRLKGQLEPQAHLLSLGGVATGTAFSLDGNQSADSQNTIKESTTQAFELPRALEQYLKDYPQIKEVVLHLDMDTAGRNATKQIMQSLPNGIFATDLPPKHGKDMNDELVHFTRTKRRDTLDY